MGLETYVGVADCHGIESFERKSDMSDYDRTCRIMRAAANGQRYAVYYEADLEPDGVGVVRDYLNEKKYNLALTALKLVSVELRSLPEQADNLVKIPDSKLDPYG